MAVGAVGETVPVPVVVVFGLVVVIVVDGGADEVVDAHHRTPAGAPETAAVPVGQLLWSFFWKALTPAGGLTTCAGALAVCAMAGAAMNRAVRAVRKMVCVLRGMISSQSMGLAGWGTV